MLQLYVSDLVVRCQKSFSLLAWQKYFCHIKTKGENIFASEIGRIDHYIHFDLLLHIKEGDACF